MWGLYQNQPAFVLGFHGCDAAIADCIVSGAEHVLKSNKPYDWLGTGAYFWESSPHRAMEWAEDMAKRPSTNPRRVQNPAVVGAIIDLGNCCNLFDSAALDELRNAWDILSLLGMPDGSDVPENKGSTPDRLGRYRDRAVIEFMHELRKQSGLPDYDTVRAAFPEGGELYPQAGFTARSHIQIAVRNPRCIKGYFKPIATG
ncbi:hypothetical protein [Roseateles paludis]|jgi:hypothetical protein|uniref:DUF3990 domain-containing protein n=1 Tax=Roseateles paludis TaxID=3145238 RepID=A0ABV0FZH3_9BURK